LPTAIDSATPSTLYAVDSRGRIFKTIDSGGSWKLRGSVADVNFLLADPTDSCIIYAATQRGVLKSTDGEKAGLARTAVYRTTIQRRSPLTL
jgi:hypothetical protein